MMGSIWSQEEGKGLFVWNYTASSGASLLLKLFLVAVYISVTPFLLQGTDLAHVSPDPPIYPQSTDTKPSTVCLIWAQINHFSFT